MPYALVGSFGTAATGTTSAAPTFAQTTTAGNLLVAWVIDNVANVGTPAGWFRCNAATNTVNLFCKPNCGASETAPTFSSSGTFMAAVLAEFSGGAIASPFDVEGSVGGLTSPQVSTTSAPDAQLGELVCGCSYWTYSMSATKTTTHAYNNGGSASGNVNNDGTSTANHYRFSYAITTGNSAADALTVTFTTTNVSTHASMDGSFKLFSPAGVRLPGPGGPLPFMPLGRSM